MSDKTTEGRCPQCGRAIGPDFYIGLVLIWFGGLGTGFALHDYIIR